MPLKIVATYKSLKLNMHLSAMRALRQDGESAFFTPKAEDFNQDLRPHPAPPSASAGKANRYFLAFADQALGRLADGLHPLPELINGVGLLLFQALRHPEAFNCSKQPGGNIG